MPDRRLRAAASVAALVSILSAPARSQSAAVENSTSTPSLASTFLAPVRSLAVKPSTAPVWGDAPFTRPAYLRGVHLTAWYAGSKKLRADIETLLAETELNTVVIAVKEINGEVYIPGVEWPPSLQPFPEDRALYPFRKAIPDIESYLAYLKERGVFTIARVVVFQDQILPKLKPEWAVQTSSPLPKGLENGFTEEVWVDWQGLAWADPFQPEVADYNIRVAERAAQLGFQGIQFDYIRFPSDGPTHLCVYDKPKAAGAGSAALATFLKTARARLEPYGVELSIDVFGLAGSYDLGIGQKLPVLAPHVDVISPMMYPSHYGKGEYGISEPNDFPFATVHRAVSDTLESIKGTGARLAPFLQDFSLRGKNVTYTADRVREQIEAAEDQGVLEWMLWNARCRYTREALMPDSRPPAVRVPEN